MKFRLSLSTWDKINIINEKYHIMCTEVTDYDDLEKFFFVFEEMGAEVEDVLYVNYVFDLYSLCSHAHEKREDFNNKATQLKIKYMTEIEKIERFNRA